MKRHITDPNTYNRIFKNRDGILAFRSLYTIQNGRSIDQDMRLVRFEKGSELYFLDKDAMGKPMKRWITSLSILNKYVFHTKWISYSLNTKLHNLNNLKKYNEVFRYTVFKK
ncbi:MULTISPECIES: hypothetical protein [Bacillus]|nr:hypothetical protein [Bacillus tropicus]